MNCAWWTGGDLEYRFLGAMPSPAHPLFLKRFGAGSQFSVGIGVTLTITEIDVNESFIDYVMVMRLCA